jgi:hypothetical protein
VITVIAVLAVRMAGRRIRTLMNGLAKVSVDTGVVFLPVETPYDQDILFEYLQTIASAHRQVEVELERLRLVVSENGNRRHRCAGCDWVMVHGAVRYVIGRRGVCRRCARALVRDAEHEDESQVERSEHGDDAPDGGYASEPGDHLHL